MIATVRLDSSLGEVLEKLAKRLNKTKSDIIRESIDYYAKSIEDDKKSRILKAVKKSKEIDKKEFSDFNGVVDDGI
jgi:predicted DNA-binding protein